jgi:HSP90 family molecular chaperone
MAYYMHLYINILYTWLKKPDDVPHQEYGAFYKSITNDWDEHMHVKNFADSRSRSQMTTLCK